MDSLSFQWKVMAAMRRFKEHTERTMHPFCAENRLTPLQLRVLASLHFEGSQTISTLAKNTCIAGANISALCKRLDQDGLVLRLRDTIDERQVNVSLTPKGQLLMERLISECSHSFRDLERRFSQEDIQVITTGMDRLLARLDDSNNKENDI